MSKLKIVVGVPFRQKIRATLKQLGLSLGRFLEEK